MCPQNSSSSSMDSPSLSSNQTIFRQSSLSRHYLVNTGNPTPKPVIKKWCRLSSSLCTTKDYRERFVLILTFKQRLDAGKVMGEGGWRGL